MIGWTTRRRERGTPATEEVESVAGMDGVRRQTQDKEKIAKERHDNKSCPIILHTHQIIVDDTVMMKPQLQARDKK